MIIVCRTLRMCNVYVNKQMYKLQISVQTEKHTQTNRQTHTDKYIQTDKHAQTYIQTNAQAYIQADIHIDKHTHRQTKGQRNTYRVTHGQTYTQSDIHTNKYSQEAQLPYHHL